MASDSQSEDEVTKRVMDNVSHEYTVCSAYYMIVSNAVMAAGSQETSEQYQTVAESALGLALQAAAVGRSEEMAQKVVTARLETEIKLMADEIDHDNANISVLNVKHIERCKWAMENVEAVMDEWMLKELTKPDG